MNLIGMDKLDLTLFISFIISLSLTLVFKSSIITYYLLIPIFILPFSLVGYQIFKSTNLHDTFIKPYVRYSYENPYQRKRALVKGAIEGSTLARISIGEIIKEAIERKYNMKLNQDNAIEILKDQDLVALIFYRDYESYFKDPKKYEYTLNKAINLVW